MSHRYVAPSEPPTAPSTYGGVPLQRILTDVTASDATADDLDGAGRVVGNLISRGGKYIETLFTKLSLVLGGGPRKPLDTVLDSLRCNQCSEPYFGRKSSLPPWNASADEVLRALFVSSCSCACCGVSRGFYAHSTKKMSKAGMRFTSILSGSNHSSQYNAILYLTALSSLLPDLRAVFMKHDVTLALCVFRYQVEHQPDGDLDFLLAPSHCALAVLVELEIHSIGKEIVACNKCLLEADTWDHFKELSICRSKIYGKLSPFWKSFQMTIYMAVIIHAGVYGNAYDFASVALDKWSTIAFWEALWAYPFQFDIATFVQHLAHSEDPVLNSMLPALLLAVRESHIGYSRLQLQCEIDRGNRPFHNILRALDILQSPDWERFLKSHYGLIAIHDEAFMK